MLNRHSCLKTENDVFLTKIPREAYWFNHQQIYPFAISEPNSCNVNKQQRSDRLVFKRPKNLLSLYTESYVTLKEESVKSDL